jgi:hypothetical protein
MPTTARQDFAELARTLKSVMSPNQGFALLMQLDGHYHYASSAYRDDMRTTLTEWLVRANAGVDVPSTARANIESKCVELGHLLEKEGHRLLLFLFDYGDRGNLAWYTNAPDPKTVVELFLAVAEKP